MPSDHHNCTAPIPDGDLVAISRPDADENSPAYAHVLAHLETCPACLFRMEQLDPGWAGIGLPTNGPSPAPLAEGTWIGEYRILGEPVGAGGGGTVYRAEDRALNRLVAIKLMNAAPRPEYVERFREEARAHASLTHPNITPLYSFGEYGGRPYFVMELARASLAACIREADSIGRFAPATPDQAAEVLERLALAVEYAHENGIVHRDLKPQNVLIHAGVSDSGPSAVKLTDFGLARADGGAGSPNYMAPEVVTQLRTLQSGGPARPPGYRKTGADGDEFCSATHRPIDVYGLGGILHEVLTGRPPYTARTREELLLAISDGNTRPSLAGDRRSRVGPIPPTLRAICLKCLAKDPRDRYPTASDVASDLRRFIERRSTIAHPRNPLARMVWSAALWVRRRPTTALLSGALVSSLLAGYVSMIQEQRRTRAALVRSEEIARRGYNIVTDVVYRTEAARAGKLRVDDLHELTGKSALDLYETYLEPESPFLDVRQSTGDTYLFIGYVRRCLNQRAAAWEAFRRAIGVYERLAEDHPTNPGYHDSVGQGYHILALDHFACGKTREAAEGCHRAKAAYERALALGPEDRETLNHFSWFLAICPDATSREEGRAVELANKLITLEPTAPRAWNDRGTARYRAGDFAGAVSDLHETIRLRGARGPTGQDMFILAMAYWKLGKAPEARSWYARAVQWKETSKPSDAELFMFDEEAKQLIMPN